ncbi:MAG: LssY C-terminal domain-containing protein [Xanthomonadales bacterium]|nr:LssY C-terminal domain-containing protein [Xanthomonadales bacterium]
MTSPQSTTCTDRAPLRTPWRTTLHCLAILAAGCLTACSSAPFMPEPLDSPDHLENLQTKTVDRITVSAALLHDDEARRHFGADLGSQGVQALWLRVRNATDRRYWFVRNTVDPDLYSADETALLARGDLRGEDFEALQQHLRDESIRVLMEPGHVTQGFLFLPREEGGRYVEVRLASDAYEAQQRAVATLEPSPENVQAGDAMNPGPPPRAQFRELRLGFALTLPDGDFDYERLDTTLTYAGQSLPDLDLDDLRAELERLPCCATNADGDTDGDPLNVVLIGDAHDIMVALSRAGWSFTHRITLASVTRMIGASLQGEGYPVAPVSSLYAFGRKQDIALQRARANIAQRNHMRLWLAPFTLEGRDVWVGQVSRDIGVKVTTKSPSLTTHIIDPEVDLTREYLLHSLLAEGYAAGFGFAAGSRAATPEEPAVNLVEDPYFSDGLRLVVMVASEPVPYEEVVGLLWEQSDAPVAEGQSEAASRNVFPISSEGLP